ncbi:hypothetical protein IC619_002490 [Hazenella sp. IB182353]|uniref:hypothetical protein n=1 Tax=Polycladospora coralii TaxID=2771432 RepID=UPI001745CAC8|nr:hypothetical protein [Polycladospora coralii]MBS7529364.1 hypothetical protein [Polycladospora coralii]
MQQKKDNKMLDDISNTLHYVAHLKENSAYITPEGMYKYLKKIVLFVINEPLIVHLLEQKPYLCDAQSAVESCVFYNMKCDINALEDEQKIIFVTLLLKYICSFYDRFDIFNAIYAYRDLDQFIDPRVLKNSRAKTQAIQKSSTQNFINEMIVPYLCILELYLLQYKGDLENNQSSFHIHIEGSVGGHILLGDFSNNQGNINSDFLKSPELMEQEKENDQEEVEQLNDGYAFDVD